MNGESASAHTSPSNGIMAPQEGSSVPAVETPNSVIKSILSTGATTSSSPPPLPSSTTTTSLPNPPSQQESVVVVSSDIEPGVNDPQWKELWIRYKDSLMDPADVHATLQDLMSTMTNKLSDTELLFLQRRVRNAVRLSQHPSENTTTNKGGGRKGGRKNSMNSSTSSTASSSNSTSLFQDRQETKTVVKNYHLLTPYVLRKVLPTPPKPLTEINNKPLARSTSHDSNRSLGSLGSTDNNSNHGGNNNNNNNNSPYTESRTIHTIETTYLLALYCNDSLWDRVSEIAVQSAKSNNIEMDVNKQIQIQQKQQQQQIQNGSKTHNVSSSKSDDIPTTIIPEPSKPTFERAPDPPFGVPLHSLTFLLGLALSKYTNRYTILQISSCALSIWFISHLIFSPNYYYVFRRYTTTATEFIILSFTSTEEITIIFGKPSSRRCTDMVIRSWTGFDH